MDGVTVRIQVAGQSTRYFIQGGVPFLDLAKVPGQLARLGLEGFEDAEITGKMMLPGPAFTVDLEPTEVFYLVTVTPKPRPAEYLAGLGVSQPEPATATATETISVLTRR
jgi:hypothetical protein